jgi:hypothetical protein
MRTDYRRAFCPRGPAAAALGGLSDGTAVYWMSLMPRPTPGIATLPFNRWCVATETAAWEKARFLLG